jgi:hypothetical protein
VLFQHPKNPASYHERRVAAVNSCTPPYHSSAASMDRRPAGEGAPADAVEDPVGFALGFILTHRKTAPSELGAPIAAAPMIGSNRGLRSSALANPFSSSQTAAAAVRSAILRPTGLSR